MNMLFSVVAIECKNQLNYFWFYDVGHDAFDTSICRRARFNLFSINYKAMGQFYVL